MIKHLVPAIMLTLLMTVVTGLAYPLAMTGIAGLLFPHQAKGSLIERDGKIIGSELIGQNFATDGYFHGRPSATTDTDPNDPTKTVPAPYNASNSGGSNLGPTSKALVDRVKGDSDLLAATNPSAKVPVDLVTTSASGLDPDMTPAAALFQVPRVAKARKIPEDRLRSLVEADTTGRLLGILGEPHVNVLKLNLALDKAFPKSGTPASPENVSAAEATSPPVAAPVAPDTPPSAPALSPEAAAPLFPQRRKRNPLPKSRRPGSRHHNRQKQRWEMRRPIFPSQIASAYAGEKPDRARAKTCSDQYRANAATNSNGGLKRNTYLIECKKRLKG